MKKERKRKSNRKMQGLYTGDQVRNHFRHSSLVWGFKLNSKSFPGKVWIAHAQKNIHCFQLKASGFSWISSKKASACRVYTTKSTNNIDKKCKQLCTAGAEFEPAPQCPRLTLSARKTPRWAFGQNYQVNNFLRILTGYSFFQNFPAHQSQCWFLQNVSLGYSSGFVSYKLMEKQ